MGIGRKANGREKWSRHQEWEAKGEKKQSGHQESEAKSEEKWSSHKKSEDKLPEVEDFVARHGLDEAAAKALRSLPAHQQREAMDNKTDLNNCRNPSAIMMARIRELG